METLTISLFSTPLNFQELVTSTVFNGYTGTQSTNEMDIYFSNHFNQSQSKEEERKGIILKKVFVLLISRRSASSPMPPAYSY